MSTKRERARDATIPDDTAPARRPVWRGAAVAAGILVTVVLTGMIWLWVIDSQAQALQRGAPAPFASPVSRGVERPGPAQSTRASDEPRPIP